ncbi:MAG: hypothetical protein WBK28_02330 [Minisyncoccia bacterium]
MRLLALIALSLFMSLGAPVLASAQALPGLEPLAFSLSPKYPRPYDTVQVKIESTLINLAASEITFTANGEVVGERSRSASITFGGPGSKMVIGVSVVAPEGTFTKELTIYPSDVALLIEPLSTAHPFYQGARLVASEGKVRLIALPDFTTPSGTKIPPSELSYTWRFGDRLLQDFSGLGQNVLTATAPVRHRDARVTVTVTSKDGAYVAEATRMVSPRDPVMRIYRSDLLSGILFERALTGTVSIASTEETLRMVPFFFSNTPSQVWTLNGNSAGAGANLTLRITGSDTGTASVRASASEEGNLLPRLAETGITVEFDGRKSSTNAFGL